MVSGLLAGGHWLTGEDQAMLAPEKLPGIPQILSSFAYSPNHNPYYIFNTFPAYLKLYKTNAI